MPSATRSAALAARAPSPVAGFSPAGWPAGPSRASGAATLDWREYSPDYQVPQDGGGFAPHKADGKKRDGIRMKREEVARGGEWDGGVDEDMDESHTQDEDDRRSERSPPPARPATRVSGKYKPHEDVYILRQGKAGKSNEDIAYQLNRTVKSVRERNKRLLEQRNDARQRLLLVEKEEKTSVERKRVRSPSPDAGKVTTVETLMAKIAEGMVRSAEQQADTQRILLQGQRQAAENQRLIIEGQNLQAQTMAKLMERVLDREEARDRADK
ncbi:hypothetical protein JCM10450v2_007881 [Rhodotorula kratochvilovae]